MTDETFRQQLRKKIIDLKPEIEGFYTESYNLVEVMLRLNPGALDEQTMQKLGLKMDKLYNMPGERHKVNLAQLERLYFRFKEDPNVKLKSREKMDMTDVKTILDKVRRDLLFYLALVEDRPSNYDIVLRKSTQKGENGTDETG